MLHVNGKPTTWTTGTRFVYMCSLEKSIPARLVTYDDELKKQVAVTIWYRRSEVDDVTCKKCGAQHSTETCNFRDKVCFVCHGDHEKSKCPNDDGSRSNDEVVCFLTEKSPLSNFNRQFPVTINGQSYTCNEQFIQSQKAELFHDNNAYADIMNATDPRDMKRRGKQIRNYNDVKWKENAIGIIEACVRAKVYQHEKVKNYLLGMGDRVIGEGSPDPFWGVGLHISDPKILNRSEWTGTNVMGRTLMTVRSEIKMISNILDEDDDPFLDVSETVEGQPCVVLLGDSNVQGMEAKYRHCDFHVNVISRPNATLEQAEEMLKNCDAPSENVKAMVVQLGSYTWQTENDAPVAKADSVYAQYVETLNVCADKFPFAQLFLSSIPPRLPVNEQAVLINDETKEVNRLLKELSKTENNLTFIDNDVILINDERVCQNLYDQKDRTGIYLNETGRNIVSDLVANALRDHLHAVYQ